ncbi:hypothetical protein [Catenulispora pinisilvae]|uniref:hypothetical protein n=1 Tax=Catenulispora pinisilvae TaxID=2705253 RepID=UPI0018922567|nr:hypothetical protein [Catenulispora pinisilvae]
MSPREAGAARRRRGLRAYSAAVLAWTVAFMTALVLLPPGAHTIATAHADSSSTTVQGPAVWIPATQTYGANGTVSVAQTTNLVDQIVHVSWTGFTPSSGNFVTVGGASWTTLLYPVVVYECRGVNPQITDCYGSSHYGQSAAAGFQQPSASAGLQVPDFPNNEIASVTHADGTGSADIEVYTANQSPTLGCDSTHQCSLVVEPNYGGDATGLDGPPNCADHGQDRTGGRMATGSGLWLTDGNGFGDGETCAWKNHVVIPMSFAPVAGACAANVAGVSAEGQPMLDRALAQWTVGACLNSADPVSLQYSSDLTEPEARSDFLQGRSGADMAFTSLPADPAATSKNPYTYVPVGSTGIAVTFFIDNPGTRLPITGMKLNARLLAKLLTQSYDVYHYAGAKSDIPSVTGNPTCIFSDPEFQALNPATGGVFWPNCSTAGNGLDNIPIVMGGSSDLVTELTSWIASDPDAKAFLSGTPDQWGMHVNTFYKSSVYPYPISTFVPQDGSGPPNNLQSGLPFGTSPTSIDRFGPKMQGFQWNPIQSGLDDVARHMLQATPSCISWQFDTQSGQNDKCAAQTVGSRTVMAIMDTGRAAAFSLPTAAIANGAGAYVAPTAPSMASAALDYVTDPKTGTQSLPWGSSHSGYSGDTAAYPLTVPNYAMAPTSGVSSAKAGSIADFLSAATDTRSGQLPGNQPGQLAPGYVGDSPAQLGQAGAAIAKIRAGAGPGGPVTVTATGPVTGKPTTSGNEVVTPVTVTKNGTASVSYSTSTLGGNGGANGGDGANGSSGSSSKGAAGPAGSSGPTHNLSGSTTAAAVGKASADTAGIGRLILPILLIIGLVLVAAGPAALVLSSGGVSTKLRALWPQAKRRFGR